VWPSQSFVTAGHNALQISVSSRIILKGAQMNETFEFVVHNSWLNFEGRQFFNICLKNFCEWFPEVTNLRPGDSVWITLSTTTKKSGPYWLKCKMKESVHTYSERVYVENSTEEEYLPFLDSFQRHQLGYPLTTFWIKVEINVTA
jgi:hypothetical protein